SSSFAEKPIVTYKTQQGELYFAAQLQAKIPTVAARPIDIAIVIDTSASQVGAPLQNARTLAEEMVAKADPQDRRSSWTLNMPESSLTRSLSGGFEAANAAKVKEALGDLKTTEYAAGASDLKSGLKKIVESFAPAADRQLVIVFLGDGESALAPLSDADRKQLAADMTSRSIGFFPVPLGPRVNSKNIHGLASATGAAVTRFFDADKPADLATRIRTSLAVRVLYPTQTTFSPEVIDVLPAQLPPLRGDCPTLAVGQMKPAEKIECRVEGM